MSQLKFSLASNIVSSITKTALARGYPPVSIHVLNCAGHTVASALMDGCSGVVAPPMSLAKAKVAVGFKTSSREFGLKYTSTGDDQKIAQLSNMCQISGLACFPGGVVIKDEQGRVIGGVGVSGASGEQDEELAKSGVGGEDQ